MGDRTWWTEKCPNCKADIKVYDAPSCMQWSFHCTKCGYDDGRDYYETGKNEISLLNKEQAKQKGLL